MHSAGLGRLDDRRAAIPNQPELRLHRAAEGIGHRGAPALAAEGAEEHVHRALASIGQRHLEGLPTGRPQAASDGGRDLDRREAALEAVGCDERGAAHGASRATERGAAPSRCVACLLTRNPFPSSGVLSRQRRGPVQRLAWRGPV
jgi:hypothetical protein